MGSAALGVIFPLDTYKQWQVHDAWYDRAVLLLDLRSHYLSQAVLCKVEKIEMHDDHDRDVIWQMMMTMSVTDNYDVWTAVINDFHAVSQTTTPGDPHTLWSGLIVPCLMYTLADSHLGLLLRVP